MIYFSSLFSEAESNIIEYNGKKVQRFFNFNDIGEYIFRFTFISSNSNLNQAIVLFYDGLKGEIFLNGKEISAQKTTFSHFTFYEDTAPKQFDLVVRLTEGYLSICNGSDSDGSKRFCHTLSFGCAMIIENISKNYFRFYCNDYENDDDFDDLIFELEIIPRNIGKTGDDSPPSDEK